MIIKQNKKHTIVSAILLIVVFIPLFCFLIFDFRELSHKPSALLDVAFFYWAFKALCLACCVVLAVSEIYFFKQMRSKEPLVEICDAYFYDNSSLISLGKIAWSDMEKVYIKSGFLNIKLKNSEIYFMKKNWLQMLLIKNNLRLGYGDVCISSERFKKEAEAFSDEFLKRRNIDRL